MGACAACCNSLKEKLQDTFAGEKDHDESDRDSVLVLIEPKPKKKLKRKDRLKAEKKEDSHQKETKRKGVAETGNDDFTSDDIQEHDKLGEADRTFVLNSLLRNGIFRDEISSRELTPADIDNIVKRFRRHDYEDGDYLFHKGDTGTDALHIAKRGTFRGLVGRVVTSILKEGDVMGDASFFHEIPQITSLLADNKRNKSTTFVLEKYDYKAIVEKGRDLGNIKLFDQLDKKEKYAIKDKVAKSLLETDESRRMLINKRNECPLFVPLSQRHDYHPPGDIIFTDKDPITDLYVVLSGSIRVSSGDLSSGGKDLQKRPQRRPSRIIITTPGRKGPGSVAGTEASTTIESEGDDQGEDFPTEGNDGEQGAADGPPEQGSVRGTGASVKSDELDVIVSEQEDFALLPGDHFGGEAVLDNQSTNDKTYLAMRETTLLKIDRALLKEASFKTVRDKVLIALESRTKQIAVLKKLRESSKTKPSPKRNPPIEMFEEAGDDIPAPTPSPTTDLFCGLMDGFIITNEPTV